MSEKKVQFTYKFGTMIEIPRAAVTAAKLPNWPNSSPSVPTI